MYRIYALRTKRFKPVYVGYTKRSLHDRWRHHKNTYPERKELEIELLSEVETKAEAKTWEIYFQKVLKTIHPNGLNIAIGHRNSDGKHLSKAGFKTRFGNRRKYPGEEAKRIKNHVNGIKALMKKIRCISNNRVYDSLGIAAEELGLHRSAICRQLKGQQSHTGGYRFEYVPSINSL
jgi:GIY-YIG catalytic domain